MRARSVSVPQVRQGNPDIDVTSGLRNAIPLRFKGHDRLLIALHRLGGVGLQQRRPQMHEGVCRQFGIALRFGSGDRTTSEGAPRGRFAQPQVHPREHPEQQPLFDAIGTLTRLGKQGLARRTGIGQRLPKEEPQPLTLAANREHAIVTARRNCLGDDEIAEGHPFLRSPRQFERFGLSKARVEAQV